MSELQIGDVIGFGSTYTVITSTQPLMGRLCAWDEWIDGQDKNAGTPGMLFIGNRDMWQSLQAPPSIYMMVTLLKLADVFRKSRPIGRLNDDTMRKASEVFNSYVIESRFHLSLGSLLLRQGILDMVNGWGLPVEVITYIETPLYPGSTMKRILPTY